MLGTGLRIQGVLRGNQNTTHPVKGLYRDHVDFHSITPPPPTVKKRRKTPGLVLPSVCYRISSVSLFGPAY